MNVQVGTVVLLYAAGTRRELAGSFVAGKVEAGAPASLWRRHGSASGLTPCEFDQYFADATIGYAIPALSVRPLPQPIPLHDLRQRWTRFSTPRTHRRVEDNELNCILNGERSLLLRGWC
jgi:predicted transcriptional regulator